MAAGHQVSVFNRGRSRPKPVAGIHQIEGDVTDADTYTELGDSYWDVVCQFLAFQPSDIVRDLNIFSGKCSQYIFVSTATVYRKPVSILPIRENSPLGNPYLEYGRNKQACEELLMAAHENGRIAATVVRPSHTYRARLPSIFVTGDHLAWRILHGKPVILPGDGETVWTLTHANDFARAFVRLFGMNAALGEIFHITDSLAYTWNRIYKLIGDTLGRPVDVKYVLTERVLAYAPAWRDSALGDKANSMIFDNRKIARIADGWSCETDLATGLGLVWRKIAARIEGAFYPPVSDDALVDQIILEQARADPISGGGTSHPS